MLCLAVGRLRRSCAALAAAVLALGCACAAQAQNVLVYDDNTNNHRGQHGIADLGITPAIGNANTFNSLLAGGTWNLVVVDDPSNTPVTGWAQLENYIAGGGKAIMSFWDWSNQVGVGDAGLAPAFDISASADYLTPQSIFRWDTANPVFNVPFAVSDLTSFTDNWGFNGAFLDPIGGAIGVAGFTASPTPGQAAIVIGNNDHTIANGFLFDEANDPNGTNIVADEAAFLLHGSAVPEPGAMALLTGFVVPAARAWRRRRLSR